MARVNISGIIITNSEGSTMTGGRSPFSTPSIWCSWHVPIRLRRSNLSQAVSWCPQLRYPVLLLKTEMPVSSLHEHSEYQPPGRFPKCCTYSLNPLYVVFTYLLHLYCIFSRTVVDVTCAMLYNTIMVRGKSGRIVLEIDPSLKEILYENLDKEGQTLKDWFVDRAIDYVNKMIQPTLFDELPNERKISKKG